MERLSSEADKFSQQAYDRIELVLELQPSSWLLFGAIVGSLLSSRFSWTSVDIFYCRGGALLDTQLSDSSSVIAGSVS